MSVHAISGEIAADYISSVGLATFSLGYFKNVETLSAVICTTCIGVLLCFDDDVIYMSNADVLTAAI